MPSSPANAPEVEETKRSTRMWLCVGKVLLAPVILIVQAFRCASICPALLWHALRCGATRCRPIMAWHGMAKAFHLTRFMVPPSSHSLACPLLTKRCAHTWGCRIYVVGCIGVYAFRLARGLGCGLCVACKCTFKVRGTPCQRAD